LSEQGFENFPDVAGDDLVAFGGGVDAVALVEAGDAADVLEEEGDEGGFVFGGQLGEEVAEGCGVGVAHGWRDLHAGEDDPGRWVPRSYRVDDRLEVGGGLGDGYSAQAVVGPEFEDEDVHRLAEHPADAVPAARGGFAADARVGDLVGEVEGVEAVFDEIGEGLAGADAIAGGEAVAEEDEMFLGVRLKGGGQQEEGQQQFNGHSCILYLWKLS
jgi:hypothetical protein